MRLEWLHREFHDESGPVRDRSAELPGQQRADVSGRFASD
jgi:hypothetical protein